MCPDQRFSPAAGAEVIVELGRERAGQRWAQGQRQVPPCHPGSADGEVARTPSALRADGGPGCRPARCATPADRDTGCAHVTTSAGCRHTAASGRPPRPVPGNAGRSRLAPDGPTSGQVSAVPLARTAASASRGRSGPRAWLRAVALIPETSASSCAGLSGPAWLAPAGDQPDHPCVFGGDRQAGCVVTWDERPRPVRYRSDGLRVAAGCGSRLR